MNSGPNPHENQLIATIPEGVLVLFLLLILSESRAKINFNLAHLAMGKLLIMILKSEYFLLMY